jgi:hypothetical protein
VSLTAIPNLRILDVGLAIRSCHKNIIIKKKKLKKKPTGKKTNEEKEKN